MKDPQIQQRQAKIDADMSQLVADAEHWNRAHPNEEPIVIDPDLTADVEKRKREAAGLSVYRIEDSEKHWVIASSEREALDLLKAASMLDDYKTIEDYVAAQEPDIAALADTELITVRTDDEPPETHTAAGWCAIHGKGFLASTVF